MERAAYLRSVLTVAYLQKRPSFIRAQARAKRLGIEDFDRADYNSLKSDVRTLGRLFEATEIDPATMDVRDVLVNSWSPGNLQVKTRLTPKRSPLEQVDPRPLDLRRTLTSDRRMRVLFVPDTHIGHYVAGDRLAPIHDEHALEVVHAVADHFVPDIIVIMGDWLDLAGFSSFDVDPAYRHHVKHALATAHRHLVRFRESCQAMFYLEGNHEARIHKYLVREAPEAHGIARVGDEMSVMSLRHLLRLDELGIEYVGPYGKHLRIDGKLVLHGHAIGARGGLSVAKHLEMYEEDTFFGHTHRGEVAYRRRYTNGHPRLVRSVNCGTLARVDGVVPGSQYPDWHQGFAALWAGDQANFYPINAGACAIDGQLFGVEAA